MKDPISIYSLTKTTWPCAKCGKEVPSEENHGLDYFGNPMVIYSPASRYWTSSGPPTHAKAIFCCAEHAALNTNEPTES